MGDVFKALADPTRRTILDELSERGSQTLFEICSRLATKHRLASSRQCEQAGLIQGNQLYVDSTLTAANASLDSIGARVLVAQLAGAEDHVAALSQEGRGEHVGTAPRWDPAPQDCRPDRGRSAHRTRRTRRWGA